MTKKDEGFKEQEKHVNEAFASDNNDTALDNHIYSLGDVNSVSSHYSGGSVDVTEL